jgi:hypothetical protein
MGKCMLHYHVLEKEASGTFHLKKENNGFSALKFRYCFILLEEV